jgi:hypothetical protein
MSLALGQWIGVSTLSSIVSWNKKILLLLSFQTIHRPIETHRPTYRDKMDTLPLWVTINCAGHKHIAQTIDNYNALVSDAFIVLFIYLLFTE